MLETPDQDLIRIYCPQHKISSALDRADIIVCPMGDQLSQKFLHGDCWEYHLECDTFIPEQAFRTENFDATSCSACERQIAHRLFCDRCNLMTAETIEGTESKLSAALNQVSFSCPRCEQPSQEGLTLHKCESFALTFFTSLEICPFCKKQLHQIQLIEQVIIENTEIRSAPLPSYFSFLESYPTTYAPTFWERGIPYFRRRWFRLLTITGILLSFVGFLFPTIPAAISNRVVTFINRGAAKVPIECDAYVTQGQRVKLSINPHDPDGDELDFKWSCNAGKISGSGATVSLATDEIFMPTPLKDVTVSVVVSDKYGNSFQSDARITVIPRSMANHPPTFKTPPRCSCNSPELVAGESVTFSAEAEDQDSNDQLSYRWESSFPGAQIRDSDRPTMTLDTSGLKPPVAPMPLKLMLRVEDGNGGAVIGDVTLTIVPKRTKSDNELSAPIPTNHPPKLGSFSPDKSPFKVGEEITFSALVSDPDDDRLFYDWETSKGEIQSKGTTATLNTTGITPGQVIITLTVSDNRGGHTSQSMVFIVEPQSGPISPNTSNPTKTP